MLKGLLVCFAALVYGGVALDSAAVVGGALFALFCTIEIREFLQ